MEASEICGVKIPNPNDWQALPQPTPPPARNPTAKRIQDIMEQPADHCTISIGDTHYDFVPGKVAPIPPPSQPVPVGVLWEWKRKDKKLQFELYVKRPDQAGGRLQAAMFYDNHVTLIVPRSSLVYVLDGRLYSLTGKLCQPPAPAIVQLWYDHPFSPRALQVVRAIVD